MADFFTRLAERALGVAPVAAADLPSMFAPAAPLELSSEVVTVREKFPSPTLEKSPAVAADRTEAAPMELPAKSAIKIARREGEPRSLTAEGEARPKKADDPSRRIHAAQEPAEPAAPGRPVSSDLPEGRVSGRARALDSRTLTEPRKEVAPLPSASAIVPTIHGESAAPTIHVSIGRVEVRAVMASPPPPRARERKAPPLRPLDQYLRERNEGRR
jgi:hypothetical protein